MEENNECIYCPVFKAKLEELMSKLDSIFDIAFEMKEFEDSCKKESCPHRRTI